MATPCSFSLPYNTAILAVHLLSRSPISILSSSLAPLYLPLSLALLCLNSLLFFSLLTPSPLMTNLVCGTYSICYFPCSELFQRPLAVLSLPHSYNKNLPPVILWRCHVLSLYSFSFKYGMLNEFSDHPYWQDPY